MSKKIKNSKHYDEIIAEDIDLPNVGNLVASIQVESIKKYMFNHFNNEPFVHLADIVAGLPE